MTKEEFKQISESLGYDTCETGLGCFCIHNRTCGLWVARYKEDEVKCCTEWTYPIGIEFSIAQIYPCEPEKINPEEYKEKLSDIKKKYKDIIITQKERSMKRDFA